MQMCLHNKLSIFNTEDVANVTSGSAVKLVNENRAANVWQEP